MTDIAALPLKRDSVNDIAIDALACAMAARLNPYNTAEPSPELIERATFVVNALLDRAGRPFVVLTHGDKGDAERLAEACGKNGDYLSEALRVIEQLTHPSAGVADAESAGE